MPELSEFELRVVERGAAGSQAMNDQRQLGPMSLRPQRSDVVLAAGVALGCLLLFSLRQAADGEVVAEPIWTFGFPITGSLLLMFRRVRPFVTLLAILACVVVYLLIVASPGPVVIPVLFSLYSVASQSDRRTSIISAAGVAILVSVAALTIAPDGPSAAGFGLALLLTLVPILIGDSIRSRRALIAETDKRVRLAEESAHQKAHQQVLDERVRIARELHDVVAHSIATINVQSGVAAHVIDNEPGAAKAALIEIKDSSKSALAELRSLLGVLRDTDDAGMPLAPSPGIADLQTLVDRYVGRISYERGGTPASEVDPVVGLIVYRIVQESLTNVMKHASSAAVEVRLDYHPNSLKLRVGDSGGEDTTSLPGGGLGLIGLTERVRAVGGTISAAPRFDGGFEVLAELPYLPGEVT